MIGDLMLATGGVPPHEIENCMNWAFGEGWKFADKISYLKDFWNAKHSNIFEIHSTDNPEKALMCIGKAYMEQNFDGGEKSTFTQGIRKRKIYSIPGVETGKGKGGD